MDHRQKLRNWFLFRYSIILMTSISDFFFLTIFFESIIKLFQTHHQQRLSSFRSVSYSSNKRKMNLFSALATAFLGLASPGAAFMAPKLVGTPSALKDIPDGYVGGFAQSQPQYAYPQLDPDLSDIEIMDNMDNIDKLTRQQKIKWPQFSWLSVPGDESSRIYQMFAPEISRLGYTDEGRIYSIICPQQGFGTALLGEMNVEVTVTGCRGWCEEDKNAVYADLGVKGRIWFSTNSQSLPLLQTLNEILGDRGFPMSKEQAINVTTHNPREPWNPIFRLINGTAAEFPHPEYAQHWDEAYGVAHLNVEIGTIETTGDDKVDEFNQVILDIFNLGSGNILKKGSILSWNVWFTEPELVDQDEWQAHADFWRKSLDVLHRSPTDLTNKYDEQTYFDGSQFKPLKTAAVQEAKLINRFISKWKKNIMSDAAEHLISTLRGIDEKLFKSDDGIEEKLMRREIKEKYGKE